MQKVEWAWEPCSKKLMHLSKDLVQNASMIKSELLEYTIVSRHWELIEKLFDLEFISFAKMKNENV